MALIVEIMGFGLSHSETHSFEPDGDSLVDRPELKKVTSLHFCNGRANMSFLIGLARSAR